MLVLNLSVSGQRYLYQIKVIKFFINTFNKFQIKNTIGAKFTFISIDDTRKFNTLFSQVALNYRELVWIERQYCRPYQKK